MISEVEYNLLHDIFKSLIHEEKKGRKFFLDAAKAAPPGQARILFEKLSVEESRHIDILQAELSKLENNKNGMVRSSQMRTRKIDYDDKEIPVIIIDGGEFQNISLPDLTLFKSTEMSELLQNATLVKIFKYAMKIEFDNFGYLVEAAKKMISKDAKKLLLKLANEEKEHFIWLQNLRNHY